MISVREVRKAYGAQEVLRGGTPPFTWSLSEGALPGGLRIVNGANGVSAYIAGIPPGEDFQRFSLEARDHTNQRVTVPMSLGVSSIYGRSYASSGQSIADVTETGQEHGVTVKFR